MNYDSTGVIIRLCFIGYRNLHRGVASLLPRRPEREGFFRPLNFYDMTLAKLEQKFDFPYSIFSSNKKNSRNMKALG